MRFGILCFCVTVLLAGSSCRPAAAPVAVSNQPVSINDKATGINVSHSAPTKPIGEMSWTDEKGGLHQVSELKGKAVILDFWATYCPPCREEIPHLNGLLAKHGDNLTIIGMNVGGEEDPPDKIAAFVKQTKVDYPIAHPDDALVNYVFADRDDIPQTIVLDRNGQVVEKFVGYSTYIQMGIDDAVEKAVKGS